MTNKDKLIVTNVRFPKDDLLEYRLMALEEGKSLSSWIRSMLRAYYAARRAKTLARADKEEL